MASKNCDMVGKEQDRSSTISTSTTTTGGTTIASESGGYANPLPPGFAPEGYLGEKNELPWTAGAGDSPKTLSLGVVGYGNVGKELVDQICEAAPRLEKNFGVRLEIVGVARSKNMLLSKPENSGNNNTGSPLSSKKWEDWKVDEAETLDLSKLADHVKVAAKRGSNNKALIVDNTASDEVAEFYADWIRAGITVVTPNKRAGSGPLVRYRAIRAAERKNTGTAKGRFFYEATVGAGLPLLRTAQDLRDTGDEVEKVEGIFSGTLSYIFNTWRPGAGQKKYSEVVNEAKEKGFTEPDPRDDLSGTDVQRKLIILARDLGLDLELEQVPVESLVPEELAVGNWAPPAGKALGDAFVEELRNFDGEMDKLITEADEAGEVLRFVGTCDLKAKTASVRLGRFPKTHPFASTQFADNIAAFTTKRYTPRPLVVSGPGAGAAVTATGIFADVLTVVRDMAAAE